MQAPVPEAIGLATTAEALFLVTASVYSQRTASNIARTQEKKDSIHLNDRR
jgi:hypothetical protein